MADYHQIIDEIEIDVEPEVPEPNPVNPGGYLRGRTVLLQSWPNAAGVLLLVFGFITAFLGSIEVFPSSSFFIGYEDFRYGFHEENAYGASLFCGVMMILTGSLSLRAVITRRISSVRKFFSMAVFATACNLVLVILQLYVGSKHWAPYILAKDEREFGVFIPSEPPIDLTLIQPFAVLHLVAASFSLVGLILLGGIVSRYYDAVLCGEVQLLKTLAVCLFPCWFLKKSRSMSSIHSINSNDSNMIV